MGEPSILAGITHQVMDEFDVDPTRVYVAGLSAGGAAAAVMAQAYPDIYAAVGIHSGLACGSAGSMPAALAAMRHGALLTPRRTTQPVPTILFHGDHDTTVSSINGDQAIIQAQPDLGLTSVTVEGRSEGGMAYTQTVMTEPDGAVGVRTVGASWRGACLGWRTPVRFSHRPDRPRCQPRNATVLYGSSEGQGSSSTLIANDADIRETTVFLTEGSGRHRGPLQKVRRSASAHLMRQRRTESG